MKLSTISRLTGAVRIRRVMNHSSESPYSCDSPLPPWVWMAWSRACSAASDAANFAMLAASPAGLPASKSSALRMVASRLEFDGDVRLGERMGDALMRADRRRPHLTLLGVVGGLGDGVASHSAADRADQDPLGVESGEHLPQTIAGGADQCVIADLDVVEEHGELTVRATRSTSRSSGIAARDCRWERRTATARSSPVVECSASLATTRRASA